MPMKTQNFDTYDEFPKDFWFISARQDLIKKSLEGRLKRKDLKILDIGCGTGFNYPALSSFGEVHNLDISERALLSCKKKGMKHLYPGDAQDLKQFKSETFDLVTAIEVLEHLEKDYACIAEVRRVLKRGGLFLFTTPAHRFLWSSDDILAEHKRRYSRMEIINKIRPHFSLLYLGYRYFFLMPPALLVFAMQKIVSRSTKKHRNSLTYTPRPINAVLRAIMRAEAYLIGKGIHLPFGISFIGVARKDG